MNTTSDDGSTSLRSSRRSCRANWGERWHPRLIVIVAKTEWWDDEQRAARQALMPKRVDANHWEVFAALKRLGWCVVSTASLGGGFPDLVAARGGVLKLIEVKDGTKKPSARKLTPCELDFHQLFAAAGCPVVIVESLDDVVKL